MSDSPTDTVPCAAYAEDVQEETQTTIPGTRKTAQVRPKKVKRDAASDSGYSSRTAATAGSQSTSGSAKLMKFVGKMTGKEKKSSKGSSREAVVAPEKTSSKTTRTTTTTSRPKEVLRVNTNIESREDAAKIQLSGEPIQRTTSSRSHDPSPPISRSTRPSPVLARYQPGMRSVQPVRISMSRPISYHAGTSAHAVSYHNMAYSPSMSIPTYPYAHPQQQPLPPLPLPPPPPQQHYHPQQHLTYISSTPPAMALHRQQTTYPFEPTLPGQYIPPLPGWEPRYQPPFVQSHSSHPPLPRRYSMAGPPAPIVDYPTISYRPPLRIVDHSRPPVSYHEPVPPTSALSDEAIYMEDNESYYRREDEDARRRMPPPQKPLMRHASTASGASKRSSRGSLEYVSRPSTYSCTESFNSLKEEARTPLISRGSSSKNLPLRTVDDPPSDRPRRSRPQSFHAAVDPELMTTYREKRTSADPEIQAERYQAQQRGLAEPQSLTAYDVKKVNKSSKGHKSRASDSGSGGGQKRSSPKKRPQLRQTSSKSDGLSVEVVEGCTATLRRDSSGYVVRVSMNEENKTRAGRVSQREESIQDRRYSASSRRESVSDPIARTILPRRPSSSHPTSRRDNTEDGTAEMNKRLTEKYKSTDDTAVEDEEYSETETRKKRSEKYEKLTAQRLHRLKPSGETRPSSRSARSANSTKSNKSTTSTRRDTMTSGQPF